MNGKPRNIQLGFIGMLQINFIFPLVYVLKIKEFECYNGFKNRPIISLVGCLVHIFHLRIYNREAGWLTWYPSDDLKLTTTVLTVLKIEPNTPAEMKYVINNCK